MTRCIWLLLVFGLLSTNVHAQEFSELMIDKIIAQVGGELVLLSDLEEQFSLMKDNNPDAREEDKCVILQSILAQRLLVNQAKLDSIVVSDEEVNAQLEDRINTILGYMDNDVLRFEEYYGESVASVRAKFREDLRSQLFAQRMQAGLMEQISVTPSEVKDFYGKIPADSLPYFSAEVEIAEILYTPQANEEEKQKAKERLQDIRERIIRGEDFNELAAKYSDDPGSARMGGNLGMQPRGTFVSEFEAAAYSLERNEISDVVETDFGFHIIQLLERRGNNINTRHILVKPEITWQDLELAKVKLDSIKNLIELDSFTFSEAVKKYSSDKTQSFNNDGLMVNPKTGNTFFETADLDPTVFFTIDTLKIGQISAPFEVKNQDNSTAFRMVRLMSLVDPHKASIEKDYAKIQVAAKERKKTKFLDSWIKTRIDDTFVDLDRDYHSCPNLAEWVNGGAGSRP